MVQLRRKTEEDMLWRVEDVEVVQVQVLLCLYGAQAIAAPNLMDNAASISTAIRALAIGFFVTLFGLCC